MCLPPMIAIAGGLISAAGSVMAGNAQAAAYEAQAKVAQQNARLAELQGVEELKKGAREEERFRQQARQFQSSQRTALAASGAQVSGSALSVLADTAMGIEDDATTIRFNTLQSKYGRDVEALNFRNQASAARASAKNARTALVDGSVAGMFGCSGGEGGTGYAWLTTAPDIEKVRLRFIRQSRGYIDRMLQRHGTLISWAHVENRPLLAWLQWSGFRVEGREGDFLKCVLSQHPPVGEHKTKEDGASCVCRR